MRILNLKSVILIFCMTIPLVLHAQILDEKINLTLKDKTIKEFFQTIENMTDYTFMYHDISVNEKVSIDVKQKSLSTILRTVLEPKSLSYEVRNKQILIKQKPKSEESRKISGIVVDDEGESIIGASILVKGTGTGTITDHEGRFTLNAITNSTLIISYLGYSSREIVVGAEENYNIRLSEDVAALDEIVVVAYGTEKRSTLVGSVEVVRSKDLTNRPVTNASSLLQGRIAGMTFSTPGGGNTPGSTPTIQIRGQAALSGSTPPLVVIDGIPSDMGDFNSLNTNDIESVSVLKDAAASAVYGARAPYGVLMVTTKMGKKNEKQVITYSGNYAVVNPVRMPKMVDSYTFALLKNQAKLNNRFPAHFSEDKLDLIEDNVKYPGKHSIAELNPGEGNDWGYGNNSYENNDFMDIWLRSSFRHQHDLSLRGGTEKTSFFVSTGYVYQPGILEYVQKTDNYKRFNINGGVETKVNDWLKLTYRSRYSHSTTKEPSLDYDSGRGRIYEFAYGAWPTTPIFNPDGSYNRGNRIGQAIGSGHRTNQQHRIDNILALDFNLAKGWTTHVDGTWRMNFNDNQNHRKPVWSTHPSGTEYIMGGTESVLNKSASNSKYWTIQGYTAYEYKLKEHTLKLQLGAQAEESLYRDLSGTAKDLFLPDLDAIATAQGQRTLNDKINDWATAGFFGRFNYNYNDRYIFEVNGRYDGSGRYSRGTRWGFFPSGFAGWIMSNESFWEKLNPVINFSKLRMSYGTLGNQGNSSGYLHVPTMSVGEQSGWIFNGKRPPYVNTPGILNMNRTWEKITTFDIGLETQFLDSRLVAEIGFFHRKSWDIIGPPTPKPNVLGTSAPQVNNAEFVTKGIELNISWRDMITKNWDYKVGFTLADGTSEITKYNNITQSIDNWYKGKKMGEIWGYEAKRFINKDDFDENGKLKWDQSKINANWFPGDVKYENLDGDETISKGGSTVDDHGDLKKIGNSTPRFRYGINMETGYEFNKGGRLDFSMFFEGVAKRDLFMGSSFYYWGRGAGNSYTISVYQGKHTDFYRDETTDQRLLDYMGMNTNSYFPRPYDNDEGAKNFQTSTMYMKSGAYIRLKNLQLTYTLPKDWVKAAKIDNCKVYFSGENLFVISALPSYIDPEFVDGGRMYPQQSVYSLGINIGF